MEDTDHIQVAIIDDDESLCHSMSRLLRAASFKPATFASAEDYLSDPDRERFHCILLDIQLEGISGLELHELLLDAGDPTPVVFITAHDAPEVRIQAEKSGCAGYFHKSDPGADVLSAIRRVAKTSTDSNDQKPS